MLLRKEHILGRSFAQSFGVIRSHDGVAVMEVFFILHLAYQHSCGKHSYEPALLWMMMATADKNKGMNNDDGWETLSSFGEVGGVAGVVPSPYNDDDPSKRKGGEQEEEEEDWVLVVNEDTITDDHGKHKAPSNYDVDDDDDGNYSPTFGTMGKGERVLKLGQEAVLFDYKVPSSSPPEGLQYSLNHFWFGGTFDDFDLTRIRYYVDDEETTPSIDMGLFLGHGIGFRNHQLSPWLTKYIGKVGRKNGIYNNYRIPFSKRIRVTAERRRQAQQQSSNGENNKDDEDDIPQCWWIIRGTAATAAGSSLSLPLLPKPHSTSIASSISTARLYLAKKENYTAQPLEEFDLCTIPKGQGGSLFQVTIMAQSTTNNYLEGCVRAYFGNDDDDDQQEEPLMLSSGLEDYFLGTYYFDTGCYHADIAGCTYFDKKSHCFSAYRFHDDMDPVLFHQKKNGGFRLTLRCGETEHGKKDGPPYMHPAPTTYTTYVWYYLYV